MLNHEKKRDLWSIAGRELKVKPFLIMGVLNITSDSFYSGSRYRDRDRAVQHGREMAEEGADIIDIGGESTRPGSGRISEDEEIERVIPVIRAIAEETDILISCDTYKSRVAEKAIEAGATIINDISAFSMDAELFEVVKESECGYILMHMKGTPADMQKAPFYKDVVSEVYNFLKERLRVMVDGGIDPNRVVIDPGIGFGKRLEDNLALLKNIDRLTESDRPVLIGLSRKAFIGKILNGIPEEERLEGSISSAIIAYMNGASIFRVHDVKETRHALCVASALKS